MSEPTTESTTEPMTEPTTEASMTPEDMAAVLKAARAEAAEWRVRYRNEQEANTKLADQLTTKVKEFTDLRRELAVTTYGVPPLLAHLLDPLTSVAEIDTAAQTIVDAVRTARPDTFE